MNNNDMGDITKLLKVMNKQFSSIRSDEEYVINETAFILEMWSSLKNNFNILL